MSDIFSRAMLWINHIQGVFDDMFDIPRLYISACPYAVQHIITD